MCAKGIKDDPYDQKSQQHDLEEFKNHLSELVQQVHDHRCARTRRYELFTVLAIIFCAIVAGANSISAIDRYAKSKKKWLMTWLDLGIGTPSYNTYWWLLVRLDPNQTELLFREWTSQLSPSDINDLIAIDGKRVKGASNNSRHPESLLHMVSAWSTSRGLILGQVKTETKSNEITAIPHLIESIDIKGAVVTIDAMGCQKDIVKKIIEHGGDYVLMVKDNQLHLHQELQNYFEQAVNIKFDAVEHDFFVTDEKGHGRNERREVYVTCDLEWLDVKCDWSGLKSIVMVKNYRTVNRTTSEEVRYYIASVEPFAEKVANATRSHWGVEDKVHWVLDVTFQEDASQIFTGHAAENFSVLRRLSLNVLRLDEDKKKSLKGKRECAGWDDDYMAHLLGLASIKKL